MTSFPRAERAGCWPYYGGESRNSFTGTGGATDGPFVVGAGGYYFLGLGELPAGSIVEEAWGHPSQGLATQNTRKLAVGHDFQGPRKW